MKSDQLRYELREDVVSSPEYDIYGNVTEVILDFFAIVDTYTGEDLYTLLIHPKTRLTEAHLMHNNLVDMRDRLNADHDAYVSDIIEFCTKN